jgi:hypothetical protein
MNESKNPIAEGMCIMKDSSKYVLIQYRWALDEIDSSNALGRLFLV